MIFKQYFDIIQEGKVSRELSAIRKRYLSGDLAKLFIHEFDDKLRIDFLVVKEKNNGAGTKFLTEVCEYADRNKKIIILSPSDDFGSELTRLTSFYKRFGFVLNNGEDKIFGIFEKMYRLPKS